MKAIIKDRQTAEHYQWGENCDSWVLANTTGLSVKLEHMPPGTKEQGHYHVMARQFFFILKGTATFYLDDEKIIAPEQKGLLIPPGARHYIANETNEPLEFLVISQPTTDNDRVPI